MNEGDRNLHVAQCALLGIFHYDFGVIPVFQWHGPHQVPGGVQVQGLDAVCGDCDCVIDISSTCFSRHSTATEMSAPWPKSNMSLVFGCLGAGTIIQHLKRSGTRACVKEVLNI